MIRLVTSVLPVAAATSWLLRLVSVVLLFAAPAVPVSFVLGLVVDEEADREASVELLVPAPRVLFVVSGDVAVEDGFSPEFVEVELRPEFELGEVVEPRPDAEVDVFGLVEEVALPVVPLRSSERAPLAEAVVPVVELAPVDELVPYTDEFDEGVEEDCAVEFALEGEVLEVP